MKAFISSTSDDLADYRAAAREVRARLSLVPVGMEDARRRVIAPLQYLS